MTDQPEASYSNDVRTFNHSTIAALAAYPALREAINDLANQGEEITLAELLDAMRDMTLTAPFADCCDVCRRHPDYLGSNGSLDYLKLAWPHAVTRKGDWLTCLYRCPRCSHTWTCGYSVHSAEYI